MQSKNSERARANERTPRTKRSEVTRQVILEAAENLFANDGIEATSMRAVALAAGQSNVAAVQYHFGDKQTLLAEIFEWRVQLMEPRRQDMIRQFGSIEGCTMSELLSVIFLPYLDMCNAAGAHVYARLLLEYLTLYGRFALQHPAEDPQRPDLAIARAINEFDRRMDAHPAVARRLHLTMITTGFLGVISEYDLLKAKGRAEVPLEDLVAQMIEFSAVGLEHLK
ncbi:MULTISPECIES: TetR/AcrR family transcriptional regulator [unclassified Novosphingobium]|uniref:TetR family transcriptional regulator n=1 Tax=Ochrobactrum sp. PW1 TaxID=1882222 RepID=A0A292GNB2_9HYPH|nr:MULTISPECIES: TetR/AcrR family transcriptional regulator [unclassified Novosphingobium]BBA74338.1 TetR family transcriptional regulator [Ochrobactrum sp. PW1]GFM29187.1 TetR family transcriptional regulator [Novosphingobium sp. PY1]CCA90914.1 TetR family transcriptional regulator [Novosphingobium sp. PP1Y]